MTTSGEAVCETASEAAWSLTARGAALIVVRLTLLSQTATALKGRHGREAAPEGNLAAQISHGEMQIGLFSHWSAAQVYAAHDASSVPAIAARTAPVKSGRHGPTGLVAKVSKVKGGVVI